MMDADATTYLSFWGKARRDLAGGSTINVWHPAAFHMLDVAAVAQVWLRQTNLFIPGIGRNAERAWPAIATLVALHDIGKFSLPFQSKLPDLWPACLGAMSRFNTPRHDTAGYGLLLQPEFLSLLRSVVGDMEIYDLQYLLRAVCGHHGSPPIEDTLPPYTFSAASRDAAKAFVEDFFRLLPITRLPAMTEEGVTAFSWWLAGLTVLSDWVGSNEVWFPPCGQGSLASLNKGSVPSTLEDYWPIALNRASKAILEAGLISRQPNLSPPLEQWLAGSPATPAQTFVASMDLGSSDAPTLVIIEDQTGSGKTEAALVLAHRLMRDKHAHGVFIALPTMATANALHERLSAIYHTLFEPGANPSLVLAHGKRNLVDSFTRAMQRGAIPQSRGSEDADVTASAQCAAWIGEDRRRAFMADCGVGTIDQALHAVLPTRHAPLRLFGLSQRVLIIDEAHAYDAYMQQELFWLVRFQAALGGHVIVLSATLPLLQRQKLVEMFNDGMDSPTRVLRANAYPLVTVATAAGLAEHAVAPRPGLARELAVQRLDDENAALAIVQEAFGHGAAVAWIRNTVDDALAAHAKLRSAGIDAILFHARFAMGDRLDIEARVQATFGKNSQPATRAQIVVGTQVMEQSLDIDFDVMVSDLAPIDLLLQRAGRLWRHSRPFRPEAAPVLYVVAPNPIAEPPADWLKGLRRTGRIYPDHGLLWRSARAIFEGVTISVPNDVRRLVELVYATDAPVPAGLAEPSGKAAGVAGAARAIAWQNLLTWRAGYARGSGAWASDVQTPTRLAEPGRTYRLGVWCAGHIAPCCETDSNAWAMSEIVLPVWRVKGVPVEIGMRAAALQNLRAEWGLWEQETQVLLLGPDGTGTVINNNDQPLAVRYSPTEGLIFLHAK